MKTWLLLSLLASSCTTRWEENKLIKSLEKPDEALPVVQVEAPKPLLDKFEVEKIESTEAATKKTNQTKVVQAQPAVPVKKVPKSKIKPQLPLTKDTPVSKLPVDYTENLIEINRRAEKVWKNYRPNHQIDQKIFMDIHYLGMTVGKIMVTNRGKKIINGKEVWHFHSRFKSAPFYSNIYELDDTVDTYVTTDQFLSIRYSLVQRETKQDVDDLQLYDRDQMKTFWFYKQKRPGEKVKNKEKNAYMPYFSVDPFSVLFLYQGLPLANGDIYEIPLVNKAKILILRSKVEGREVIELENQKKIRAIRVHATTTYTGETLKSGDLTFWFSDDGKKHLLRAKAKIQLGSVTADIVDN